MIWYDKTQHTSKQNYHTNAFVDMEHIVWYAVIYIYMVWYGDTHFYKWLFLHLVCHFSKPMCTHYS